MVQLVVYACYSLVAIGLLLYGLYGLLLPRWRARLSLWRLAYRIVMVFRRKPAGPVARWRLYYVRGVGVLCVTLGTVWLANLHPQIRFLSEPLYTPGVHRWLAENGTGVPEETRELERLGEVTRTVLENSDVMCAGMCAGVVHGERTYVLGVGRKSIADKAPPDADTEYEIGSITKTFTSAALASLVEEGQIGIDDPVASLLPGWIVPERGGRTITLRDLATHRSGLPRMPDEPMPGAVVDGLLFRGMVQPYRHGTAAFVRGFLAAYQLPRMPGAEDEYSNLGAGLLGYALGQKTHQSYEEMVRQRILTPLGMHDSGVTMNPDQSARFAQGYIGPIRIGRLHVVFPMQRWIMAEGFQGCGCLSSTVHDMLKYVRANIMAPAGPLGSVLARVQEPQYDVKDVARCKVGLAMMAMDIDGLDDTMYWHNGGTGGFNSFMAFSKKHRIGVVMLASGACDEALGREIIKALAKMEK